MTAIAYIEEHYQLRYNEWSQHVEMKVSDSFVALSPRMLNTLMLEMLEAGIAVERKKLLLYLNSTRIAAYHPARAYLEMIAELNIGKKDYIFKLLKNFPGLSDQAQRVFRVWLRGEVAAWLGWLDRMPKTACRTTLVLEGFTQQERNDFVSMILPETLAGSIDMQVKCGVRGGKLGKNEWRLFLRDEASSVLKIARKLPHKEEMYVQVLSELNKGEKWWFEREELRQISTFETTKNNTLEVALFLQAFVPVVVVADGVRSLRLTDIADCVSFRTGKTLNASQRNRLGRWLTAESKAGRVLKRYINGSTSYLVKGNGWTL